jgi:hypothetical protein
MFHNYLCSLCNLLARNMTKFPSRIVNKKNREREIYSSFLPMSISYDFMYHIKIKQKFRNHHIKMRPQVKYIILTHKQVAH